MPDNKVVRLSTVDEIKKGAEMDSLYSTREKQKEIDMDIQTFCKNCMNLLDASDFYGKSQYSELSGDNFYCEASPMGQPLKFYDISPLTGKKILSFEEPTELQDTDGNVVEGRAYFSEYETEPSAQFHHCKTINDGNCKKFFDIEIAEHMLQK